MVSRREVERLITDRNAGIQWGKEAKDTFCKNVVLFMNIMINKIESARTGNHRRITETMVDSAFMKEIQRVIMVGEEE
tara:strand:- start:1060 stop:1293 length:234 start_codon:yes stop_codon:yes gene_type:complete